MRQYRYYFVFIVTLCIGILLFLSTKNSINLMDYVDIYYSEDGEFFKPNVSIDYLALSSDIGSVSEEEMQEKVGEVNILDSLATLFVSDYSSLINSITVEPSKVKVKEGDKFKVNIKWDKELAKKTGVVFVVLNNKITVENPEDNTLSSQLLSFLGLKNDNKNYFTIVPLNDNKISIKPFEKFKANIGENVILENDIRKVEIPKETFDKYFISNPLQIINVYGNLGKEDIKFILFSLITFTSLSVVFCLIGYYISKDKTIISSFYPSLMVMIIIILSRYSDNIFKIPSELNAQFFIFIILCFLIISVIMEILTLIFKGFIGIIELIFIILMTICSSLSIFGSAIIIFSYYFISYFHRRNNLFKETESNY